MKLTAAICITSLSLLILSIGCDGSPPEIPLDEFPADPDLPAAVVELPSTPPAAAFEIREYNDDGTLRIEGLISNRDRFLDRDIEVKGIITDIEGDCDPRRARERGESCPEPHLFIRDHADEDRRLLVVGFTNDQRRRMRLSAGEEFLFGGSYKRMSEGFISTEDGLLVLATVNGDALPE
jgi:hypothetical protein